MGGLPAEGMHPKRRMILFALGGTASGAYVLLTIAYFWTRHTSAGLSTLAPWLYLSVIGVFAIVDWPESGLWVLPPAVIAALPYLFALRVTAPWALEGTGWMPWGWRLRHRMWTHRERTSRRRELPLLPSLLLVLACTVGVFALDRFDLHLIHSASPAPEMSWKQHAVDHLDAGVELAALIMQVYLNHRGRTFAGNAAVAMGALAVKYAAELAYLTPFVGRYEPDTLRVVETMSIAGCVAMMWQAMTLPRVPQDVADEDDE